MSEIKQDSTTTPTEMVQAPEKDKEIEQKGQNQDDKTNPSTEKNETSQPLKKKKVMKAVRFNLEAKRAENAEKVTKLAEEIKPVGENKGLFPEKPTGEASQDMPSLESIYTDKELSEMELIKQWLFANLQRDVSAAKSKGASPLELKVKNFMLVRKEDNELWNRVEFDTSFDFTQIEQILLSPEEPHPIQQALKYVTVVLFGKNKNVPLVFPYCYQKQNLEDFEAEIEDSKNRKEKKKLKKKLKKKMGTYTPNELDNWVFVNSLLKEASHQINAFHNI